MDPKKFDYKFIRKMRVARGFSQEHLANKLGVSRPTLVQIEKGRRELSLSETEKLANIFGLSFSDFLSQREATEPEVTLSKEKKKATLQKQELRISVPQKKIGKFKEVLLYVLEKIGANPNVGQSVIYKILYFIDFDYYEKFEEQLIGATYIKNRYGPTPVEFAKIVTEMREAGDLEEVTTQYFKYEQKKYLPHRSPNLKLISAQEIKEIDKVLERLSDKSASELSHYSHKDIPWLTAEEGKPIDYEAVFYRTPEYSVRGYDDDLQSDSGI